MQDDVLGCASGVEGPHQFEANALRDLDEGELVVHEIGVLGRADAVGQRVRGTAHASVRISCLDEVTNVDELLSGDLVADAWADTVLRGVVTDPSVLLEHILHVPQGLDLLCEAAEPWHPGGIQEMVLEDSVLRWVGQ